MNTCLPVTVENNLLEPFEDRIDILFRELELATKWQRPSVLLAVYRSEYVRADADIALENHLHSLGQSAYHIKIKDQAGADICCQLAELSNLDNVVFFVEGLGWGADRDNYYTYQALNNRRDFFLENQVRIVFWLTEKEAIDLAHYAPDYWTFRHRVIEFVDSPNSDQISPQDVESTWQWTGEFTDSTQDVDAKIALRMALLTDLPSGNESTAARANLLLTLGILHWRKGDYERAKQFLNTALDLAARLEDNYFEALCFNAIALVQTDLGKIDEAIQAYQNAIRLAPSQISPWNNLGNLYRKQGRQAEALSAFQKATEQNGSDATGWNGLGDMYRESGQNDDAIYAYMKAIEYTPNYANSWCGLGISHFEEGRLEEALAAHQKAIEIDRSTVNSWLGLGHIHRKLGNNENASMAFRTALEIEPRNAEAWNELGNIFYDACAYDEAMRSYQKSIECNHGGSQSYGNLASIYILKGLHSDAIPLLLRGLELSDGKKTASALWRQLGDAYQRLEDYENAKTAYQKADELTGELTQPKVEIPLPSPSLETTPAEGSSPQETPNSELGRVDKEHPEIDISTPISGSPSNLPIYENDLEENPASPDNDFRDWLEGLASVMPVTPQPEEATTDRTSMPSTGQEDAVKDPEKATSVPIDFFNQPILSDENETEYSSKLFMDDLADHFSSDIDWEENSFKLDEIQEMDGTLDEDSLSHEAEGNSELGETDIYEENLPQANPMEFDEVAKSQDNIDVKNAQIWNELGNIYYNTGAYEEASHAFEMAIELDPFCGWSYNNLASVHLHQKHYADAIPLYQKGLKLMDADKDKAFLWNRLGDAYRRMSKHDQAATAYQKAIELDPENVSLLTRARLSLLGNLLS